MARTLEPAAARQMFADALLAVLAEDYDAFSAVVAPSASPLDVNKLGQLVYMVMRMMVVAQGRYIASGVVDVHEIYTGLAAEIAAM